MPFKVIWSYPSRFPPNLRSSISKFRNYWELILQILQNNILKYTQYQVLWLISVKYLVVEFNEFFIFIFLENSVVANTIVGILGCHIRDYVSIEYPGISITKCVGCWYTPNEPSIFSLTILSLENGFMENGNFLFLILVLDTPCKRTILVTIL